MEFNKLTIEEFADKLSGSEPVPGGGGASALMGAVGAALGSMVGSLTVGKKKYVDVEEDMLSLNERARELCGRLQELMDEDAKAFYPLYKAYGMPKDTPEQAAEKERVMESALVAAAEVPLKIMRLCADGIELQSEYAKKGSAIAVSDAGVGAAALKAGLLGASLNVFINTKSMKNAEKAAAINADAQALTDKYAPMADEIFDSVRARFGR